MKWLIVGILSGLAIGIGAGVGIGFGIWGSVQQSSGVSANATLPTQTTTTPSATTQTTTPSATETGTSTSTSTAATTAQETFPPMPVTSTSTSTAATTAQETFPPMPVIDTSGITKMSCPYDVTRSTQFNLTWTPSTNDEVDALERIRLIMEGALLFYKCYTNITIPGLILVYDPNVPTATGSMATRTITFGANRQYHTLRVAMHELAHVLGMGTGAGWYDIQLNNGTFVSDFVGVWSGQETIKELAKIRSVLGPVGDNETAYIQTYLGWYAHGELSYVPGVVYMFESHFAPYGLLFEDEITLAQNPVDVYIAHCRMMMAFRRDLMLP